MKTGIFNGENSLIEMRSERLHQTHVRRGNFVKVSGEEAKATETT